MKRLLSAPLIAASLVAFSFVSGPTQAQNVFPNNPTWTTILDTTVQPEVGAGIEGLTGTDDGFFYVADRTTDICNIWEIDTTGGLGAAVVTEVGEINRVGCRPSGLAIGPDGAFYLTTGGGGGFIYRQQFGETDVADEYATGVPGANGVAFVGGTLYVTDGTANQGRVWQIGAGGGDCNPGSLDNCVEIFRVQARRNGTNLGGNVDPADQPDGVGSVRFTVPRFSDVCVHHPNPSKVEGCLYQDRQDIVANGIAFTPNGRTAYVADTSRGAIWKAEFDGSGNLLSPKGCDPTFNANTLCIEALFVAHPLLEGVDGIVLLGDGNILGSANERNSIVSVSKDGAVVEEFVNPVNAELVRNEGPLEFPTSPFVSGNTFCTSNQDSPRRDNNPTGPGEGRKVICLDQALQPGGQPVPVQ